MTFADGSTTATIHVPVSADGTPETDETFTVTLGSAPDGYVLGSQATAIGTIQNDDATVIPAGSFATAYVAASAGSYVLLDGTTRTQTAGIGVSVTATAGPVDVDIEGTLNDTASGQRAINFANNAITGSLTVGANGLVQSLNQDAVRVQSVNGTINLTNLGQIVMGATPFTPSVGGTNPGSAYAITYNAAKGAAGAPATDYTSGGTITNGSSANAAALIRSDNGDAIRLGSHQTLVNWGTINGNGPVNDSSSNNSFNSSGNTSVAETYDISRGVRINQAGATAIQVQNHGTITGAQHGLDTGVADATNIVVTNYAGASIIGRSGSGVGSDTAGAAATTYTVDNFGLIRGDYHPQYDRAGYVAVDGDGDGVDIDGGATINNHAGGQILATGAGGYDSNGRANQSEGISIGGGVITNAGTISGANAGIVVNNDSNTDGSRSGIAATTIANYAGGTITGEASYAVRFENKTGTVADNDAITNYGTITGNGTIPTGTVLRQDGNPDAGTVGTLDGVTYTAADAGNARFIRGDGSAIQMGEGDDALANYGSIVGNSGRAINLEGGNDMLTLYTGSSVTGQIDGGAGTDTLHLRLDDRPASGGGLTGDNSGMVTGTIANVVHFEMLDVHSGSWSIVDAQSYASGVTIESGATLVLSGGGALTAAINDLSRLTVDSGATVLLDSVIGGSGIVEQAGSGVLQLANAANSYSGGTALNAGTLDVMMAGAAGSGAITFGAGAQTIVIETAAVSAGAFANQISGFAPDGDTIDVRGIGVATAAYDSGTGDLTLTGAGSTVLHVGAGYDSYTFHTADDGAGGTIVQVSQAAPPTTAHIFDTDFAPFTAGGFAPGATAASGQLDSNMWRVIGLSDNAHPAYGFTGPAGGDFGRGLINGAADPVTAGVYSPSADHALVFQPTGAELDINGYIEARFQNTSGSTATSFDVAFDWAFRNSAARSDNLELQYSTDGSNFTPVTASDFSTPGAATSPVPSTFTNQHETVTIDGVVASGGYLYLRWVHLSSTGGGSRDEVGIDNVSIDAHLSTTPTASVTGGSIIEGNSGTSEALFTITRSSGDGAASVDYATQDGTATAGSDYAAQTGTITFAAGELSKTVAVTIYGDTRHEADETFSLKLSNPTGFQVPQSTATMTIVNDDTGPVAIYDIQGSGHRSPFTGQAVATGGVVTAVTSNGFYLQDPTGDGDIGTSDAVFVFTSAAPTVSVGNQITLSGTVTEYVAATNQLSVTELTSPTAITIVNASVALPDAVVISTDGTGRAPPTSVVDDDGLTSYDPVHDGADFYESLEGMRVTISNPLVVSNTDANGQTFVVASGGIGATGLNSRSGMTISAGDLNPETLKIFEGSGAAGAHSQGDVLNDVTGIVNYFGGRYEVDPVTPVTTAVDKPLLPRETGTLYGDASHLSYASFNVENLGPVAKAPVTQAEVDARYAAHADEVVHALNSPDVIGLQEIQDANGENTGGDLSGQASAQKLIDAIAAAGGPTYAYVEVAPSTNNATGGVPEGNIRNGFLYNTQRVSYVDGSAHLISGAAYTGSRQPLVADFKFNGELFTAIDVHSTSRGGSDPVFSSNQPPVNAGDASRTAQAQSIADYVNNTLATDPTHKFVVNGDFNGFYYEAALQALAPESGGALQDLYYKLPAEERYSYYFDGYYQAFDYVIVSNSLYADTAFDIVHYNAGYDPSLQVTDHDQALAAIGLARAGGDAVAVADGFRTTAVAMYFGTVLANDTGGGDTVSVAALNGDAGAIGQYLRLGSGAELVLHADGTFLYDADGAFSGLAAGTTASDHFSYTLNNGSTADVTVTISAVPTPAPDGNGYIDGTAGNDVFGGTQGADRFDFSSGGNDTVNGGAGDDYFFFGAAFTAADHVNGGSGGDQIALQGDYTGGNALVLAANTLANVELVTVLPGFSYDITTVDGNVPAGQRLAISGSGLGAGDILAFNGAAETDGGFTVTGGAGADRLTGGHGYDYLDGGAGNDILIGGGGPNVLFGGDDNDTITSTGLRDMIDGGAGDDIVYLGTTDAPALLGGSVQGGAGNDTLYLYAVFDGSSATSFGGFESVLGYNGGPATLIGSAGDDVLYLNGLATPTNDFTVHIFAGTGNDVVFGSAGADVILGDLGNDTLAGGLGDDLLTGNQGNDILTGNQGNDILYGGQDDDQLFGGQGDDQLFGGLGDDLLQGGLGRDVMSGGAGNDTFKFLFADDSPLGAPDLITDFASGSDKIDLTALRTGGADSFQIVSGGGDTFVDVDLGGNGSIDLRIQVTGTNAVMASDILWGQPVDSSAKGQAAPSAYAPQWADDDAASAGGHVPHQWTTHGDFTTHYAIA